MKRSTRTPRSRRIYDRTQTSANPARTTIQGLGGTVLYLRRTRDGATLTAVQDGRNTAVIPLSLQGLTELAEQSDEAAEAVEVPARLQPSTRRHAINDMGECTPWCNACRENHQRGLNYDGTVK